MVSEKMIAACKRLELLLPSSERSDVNDRTLFVWRRRWMAGCSVQAIALERGWSIPAVEWHLRRASRMLRSK